MELRHLRYFVAVAEVLSFSQAALRLRVTQPALSRQISDLEEELGVRLLRRGRNARTELTPEGRRFLKGAQKLIADADRLAISIQSGATQLRVGHYSMLWMEYFSPVFRKFARAHPNVSLEPVEMTPRELIAALRRDEIDVALLGVADESIRDKFLTREVAAFPSILALPATHPLAKRRKLRFGELRNDEWASWSEKEFPGRRKMLLDACRADGFKPKIVLETDSMASLFVHIATRGVIGHVIPQVRKIPHAGVVLTDIDPPTAMTSSMEVAWRKGDARGALIEDLVKMMTSFAKGGV